MDIKEKMHTCELYLPGEEELLKEQMGYLDRLYDFNNTRPTELEKRSTMLKEMFAEIGENCYIELLCILILADIMFILEKIFMQILI